VDASLWVMVDIVPRGRLRRAITLAKLKSHPQLKHISLVKQSRLSVCPITKEEWDLIKLLAEQEN
jgi:predicted RNA-binding protein with PUA-like domain